MNIKSSICGIQHTCINFLIFLIITKIECWPVFKQDPSQPLLERTCYSFHYTGEANPIPFPSCFLLAGDDPDTRWPPK